MLAVKSPAQDGEPDIGRLTKLYQRTRTQSNGVLDGVVKGAVPTSRLPMVRRGPFAPGHRSTVANS